MIVFCLAPKEIARENFTSSHKEDHHSVIIHIFCNCDGTEFKGRNLKSAKSKLKIYKLKHERNMKPQLVIQLRKMNHVSGRKHTSLRFPG